MNITMQRRAEIALNSLNNQEKGRLKRALESLKKLSIIELSNLPEMRKLVSISDKNLYAFNGSEKLKIILSVDKTHANACIVEDIFPREQLESLNLFQ